MLYLIKNGYKIYLSLASEFASSYIGSSIQITSFALRDGVTLIVSIVLNIICFIQMKRQMVRKEVLTNETSNRVGVTVSALVSNVVDALSRGYLVFGESNNDDMRHLLVVCL
jgi:hypothetical protein